jgi:hypothetical protein
MAVVASATGAAVFGLSGVAAGLAGGALLGAGAGALYSGITGDGNILNSALTGGLLGATAGGLGAAFAPAAAGTTAAGTTAAGATPALTAAKGAGGTMGGISAGGAFTPSVGSSASFALPQLSLTGGQKLAAGLAGTTALSMLGGKNQPTIQDQDSDSYIRPYTYSQKRNPNYGLPGESYYIQSYEAQEPYKAASGGIMRMANGGAAQPVVPMQQLAAPVSTYGPATGSNEAQVAGLYRNVLGRAPDSSGAKFWEDALGSGAKLSNIKNEFIASPENQAREAQRTQVADYNKLLAERANNEYNVQPPPLSTLPGGGERASAADTSKIINQYYQSELGRQGEQAGLDFWTQGKQATGMSLADIKKQINDSPEGRVFDIYQEVLGRRPDEGGRDYWTQALVKSGNPADIRREIESSPEAKARSQAKLENTPGYKDYMSAPISAANFDRNAYLAAHPDVARAGVDPFQHYQQYGIGEGRAVTRLPFQPTSGKSGYTYNPATKSFTVPAAAAPSQEGVGLPNFNDPGFQTYLQNQYNQYQQAQSSGGGAAGGLMPNSLRYAMGGNVQGYNLGGYSDGGRLLKGPGDGVSDDIPATIGNRQPARLADGEFVIPARIVSELGNGSTDAGAKRLYAMMDRIQAGRKKTVGKGNVAKDTKAKKHLLA